MNDFNFQEVACKIYSILIELPATRDSDRMLLSTIWNKELEELNKSHDFLVLFEKGMLSNPETVCRMRRKLQEEHPCLRGEKWEARHNIEGAICQQLTFFNRW